MTLHPKNTLISSILGFFFFQKIVSQGLYHLPFLKTFSDFVHFCPKFTIILPFFCRFKIFFWPFLLFSWKIACPYFLEFALTPTVLYVYSKSKKKKKKIQTWEMVLHTDRWMNGKAHTAEFRVSSGTCQQNQRSSVVKFLLTKLEETNKLLKWIQIKTF